MLKNIFIAVILALITSCVGQNDKYSERRIPQKNAIYIQESSLGQYQTSEVKPYSAPQKAKIENYKTDQAGFFNKLFKEDSQKQEALVTDEVAVGSIAEMKKQYVSQEVQNNDLSLRPDPNVRMMSVKPENNLNEERPVIEQPVILTERAVINETPRAVVNVPEKTTIIPKKSERRYVQVGAFRKKQNASRLATSLEKYGPVSILPRSGSKGELFLVRIGPLHSQEDALNAKKQMHDKGFKNAFVITK